MPGFTGDYAVPMLVWYEPSPRTIEAPVRAYALKRWRRAWKPALIEAFNPASWDQSENRD
jgi:putative endonuclease